MPVPAIRREPKPAKPKRARKAVAAKAPSRTAPGPSSAPLDRAKLTHDGKPRARPPRSCRKCGAPGFRSDGCGRTHNVRGESPASDDSEDEPGERVDDAAQGLVAVMRSRRRREIAPAEERVIPHAALVAMLAADRAQNAVGDAGGFIARADREPSLIGHTDEKRELCPVHGWVGRVAFERDRHEHCLPVGDPCSRCEGRKIVAADFCDHCEGSGIEPPATDDAPAPTIEDTPHPIAVEGVVLVHDENTRNRVRVADRGLTIAPKKWTRAMMAAYESDLEAAGPPVDEQRPRTRGDCAGGLRPCPWVACKHHLYLDVNGETGSITFHFPTVEPDEMIESCSLDIAELGGITLEDVGNLSNLTRERIRQVELKALMKAKQAAAKLGVEDAA